MRKWAVSEWSEYQAWIHRHGFVTLHDWHEMRRQAMAWKKPPRISIVTPTYNTDPVFLNDCVDSVLTQAYPHWELCLADDGSSRAETLEMLEAIGKRDKRIKISLSPVNTGICLATNRALAMASGDYIAFMDHDDRLAPDALFRVVQTLMDEPGIDIVYSDRDMLSQNDRRFMHLFKPGWSPELLLSINYVCHLMVYRRALLQRLGGIRRECEGSQDYDLILRAMELNPEVRHIPAVLYHWRQHEQSVALVHNVKDYAYRSGVRALQDALHRRGLKGDVREIPNLWRGHYRVRLERPSPDRCRIIRLAAADPLSYAERLTGCLEEADPWEYLLVLGPGIDSTENDAEAVGEMISWFQIPEIGMVTGRIVGRDGKIKHGGLVHRPEGVPLSLYEDFPGDHPGYMGVTRILRNVSAPHPSCFAVRRGLWDALGGLAKEFRGPHGVLDLAVRASQAKYRIVFTPFAQFTADEGLLKMSDLPEAEACLFADKWKAWLSRGDPCYSRWLTLRLNDMGVNLDF